jgi:hypothetical protein
MCDNKDVIPITTPITAYLILILNIFLPGVGTMWMACAGDKFIGINILHGLLQIITAWLIIGWVCAILWGVLCVNRALETEVVNVSRHVVYLQSNPPPVINQPQNEFINNQPNTNYNNPPSPNQYYTTVPPQQYTNTIVYTDKMKPEFIHNQGFTSQNVYVPTPTDANLIIATGQGDVAKNTAVQENKAQDFIVEQVQPSYINNLPQVGVDKNRINQIELKPNYDLPTKEEIDNKK